MYKMQGDSLTVQLNGSSCATLQNNVSISHDTLLKGLATWMYTSRQVPSSVCWWVQLITTSSIVSTNSVPTQIELGNLPKEVTFACNVPSTNWDKQDSLTLKPSSQLIQRHPLVKKHPIAWRATWWIQPSVCNCRTIASIQGKPVKP